MNIGVFLPNWIGDVVMATPVLRALRETWGPQARMVGVMRPYVQDVLRGSPWLNETLTYDPRAEGNFRSRWKLAQALRAHRLDAALLLTNSLSTALVAWCGGAKRRIGYARYGRSLLLTESLQPPRQGKAYLPISAVDYYLELGQRLGCKPDVSRAVELATTPEEEEAADLAWDKLKLRHHTVVALNTGGAYGGAKHWPTEHFGALARKIAAEFSARVLVLCGPSERGAAAEVERLANHPSVVSLAGETLGVGLTKACLKRSALLVSNDSGPRHLAAGFNVPTVALFGPTDPRWSENYNPREVQLFRTLDCRPCAARVCPLQHHACMRDLGVNTVFAAAARLLSETTGAKVA